MLDAAQHNSSQAIQWALKKKKMLERAKLLQEQHRYGIPPPPPPKPTTKPPRASVPYEEGKALRPELSELEQARASLTLLKRKLSAKSKTRPTTYSGKEN